MKTVVTFKSVAFNTSEHRDYFINPGCFGDDVARWLAEQLRTNGYAAEREPGQEDFGWYFNFEVAGIPHCFVIGYRPGSGGADGVWIGWLERRRGLLASLVGGRQRGIAPAAARAVHEVLANSAQFREVRWHEHQDRAIQGPGASDPY